MRQNIEEKILKVFFEDPVKSFSVREVSKLTKIPRATTHKKLLDLRKSGLINKENQAVINNLFKIKKINFFVEKIIGSGLIDYLIDELNPSCIILFGSIRKGDSIKESDLDLFVETSINKKLDFKKFERKIGHKVQLFCESNIKKLQDHLFNNVINGIKLYGSFKLK